MLAITLAGQAEPLPAQAPLQPSPASDQLPRFTLRQIVIERNDSLARIPGRWLRAAQAAFPDSLAVLTYTEIATRSGLVPLQGGSLAANRSQHVMGLYRRAELVNACRQVLASIRGGISSDVTRARFDRIFRPHGEWIVDLEDAALDWARSRDPDLRLSAAWRSLVAAHWLDRQDSGDSAEATHRALYGLAVLTGTDSVAYAAAEAALLRSDSASAAAAVLLLKGYSESRQWYSDALSFLLTEPWIPEAAGRSVQNRMREEWRGVTGSGGDIALPQIQTQWFGYPQAVPHYGVPARLFAQVIKRENPEASRWLEQNGQPRLLQALRSLPAGDSGLSLLQTRSETLRLTTASRQARESLNGFLEPHDAIAIDPGYSPLLALGAIVHEWVHLLFRRYQLEQLAAALERTRPALVRLPQSQPHIAEGFAEWGAERILAPLSERWPLLGLGELEKRAGLVQAETSDQHVLGYALARAVNTVVKDTVMTMRHLLRHAQSPSGLVTEPAFRRAWGKYPSDGHLPPFQSHGSLIPEVTFTIEDGYPDVVATRILVP